MPRRFPPLPNVSELLETPQLQGLLQRFQPAVVTSGLRSFWDRMQTDFNHRTKDWTPPPPAELAEKLAAWLLQRPPAALRPAINGTGVMLPEESLLHPLGATAGAAAAAFERQHGFGIAGKGRESHRELEASLLAVTGGQAALFFENEALAAFAICRWFGSTSATVKTALRDLERRSPAGTWTDLAKEAGARVDVCGSIESCALDAYDLPAGESVWIWKHYPAGAEIRSAGEAPSVSDLAGCAHRAGGKLLVSLGVGALENRAELSAWNEPSVTACLEAGADLVLLRGDGLVGGPAAGIVVGSSAAVDALEKQTAYACGKLSPLTAVILERILLAHQSSQADERVEILSLLSTSPANLLHRAQRLAPQIAAMPWVRETEVRETQAYLRSRSVASQAVSSVGIFIRPERMTVDDVRARLKLGRPALYVSTEGESLLLDLRGVAPALDVAAIEALSRLSAPGASKSSDSKPVDVESAESNSVIDVSEPTPRPVSSAGDDGPVYDGV